MSTAPTQEPASEVTPSLIIFRPSDTPAVVPSTRGRKPKVPAKLPRGLWVGRQPKKGAPPRDLKLVPEGVKPWDFWPDHYYPDFFCRLVRANEKVIKKSLETSDYRTAVKRALVEHELWKRGRWDARSAQLFQKPKAVPTAGQVFDAYETIYEEGARP